MYIYIYEYILQGHTNLKNYSVCSVHVVGGEEIQLYTCLLYIHAAAGSACALGRLSFCSCISMSDASRDYSTNKTNKASP